MQYDSSFIAKEPCPKCGSGDNLARYSDGHGFCFGCKYYEHGDGVEREATDSRPRPGVIPAGDYMPLTKRGIHQDTCEKYGYSVGEMGGSKVQIAPYYDAEGQIVAQKVRYPNKDFKFLGSPKGVGLFGQQLFRHGGKRLIITEGEIDALSASQMFGNKWPAVSVKNGAQGAAKCVKDNYEFVSGYDEIVICFDMDEPGRKAAAEVAQLLPPGKAKIASLPLKDANEMLQAQRQKDFVSAVFEAKTYRPDGIVNGTDLHDSVMAEDDSEKSTSFPFQRLQEMTEGFRPGELVLWTAGSGVGKSAVVREVEWHVLQTTTLPIGVLRLEESVKRAARDLMGLAVNRRLRKKAVWDDTPEDVRKEAYAKTLGTGRVFFYDHFGSTDIDNLLARIRYLAVGCGCRMVVLDHVSIVVSGREEGDERRIIDNLMTALKTVAMETGITIHLIAHLKRPSGDKGHEQGVQTSLSQLRGSHSLAQLSDTVIGVERDQQADDNLKNVSTLRILKCRWTGETGEAGWLVFNPDTGRMEERFDDPSADSNVPQVGMDDDAPF